MTTAETETEISSAQSSEAGRAYERQLFGRFSAAALGGMAAGFLVGGIGGRLAMFILRVTSDDRVVGIQSDDDFTIGQITSDSVFLIGATTLLGTMLAFGYLLVRRWLPERRRPLQAAAFFGLVGGAAVIKPDGVDFTLLDPLPLAIALFVALPAGYGWMMAALVERLVDRPAEVPKLRVGAVVVFAVVGFFGMLALGIAVAGGILILIGRRWPAAAAAVTHPVPTGIVRFVLLVIAGISLQELFVDAAEIL